LNSKEKVHLIPVPDLTKDLITKFQIFELEKNTLIRFRRRIYGNFKSITTKV